MFRISEGKGFQMVFANGWTVSVQWGYQNYCSNQNYTKVPKSSIDAEVAAWNSKGKWFNFGSDSVRGYMNANDVLAFINKIARMDRVNPRDL